jgi:hypothetical protein
MVLLNPRRHTRRSYQHLQPAKVPDSYLDFSALTGITSTSGHLVRALRKTDLASDPTLKAANYATCLWERSCCEGL